MTGELIRLIATDLPVAALAMRLEAELGLWRENTWRQDYVVELERPVSPQQDTEAVMFRWALDNRIESVRDSLDVVSTPNFYAIPEMQKLLSACLGWAGATECGRVFVAKLKPGGRVVPHQDYGMYADHFERFHLVLTSAPGNQFFVCDTRGKEEMAEMRPGQFFNFCHKETHWAVNGSKTPRMHLIIDAVAPAFRRERVTLQS